MKTYGLAIVAAAAALVVCFGCGETTTGPGAVNAFYVGSQACRECHATVYDSVAKTRHALTFTDDPNNPNDFYSVWHSEGEPESCLPCHTTGWDTTNENHGADEPAYRKRMMTIQCEACHGPASEHIKGGGDPSKITLSYAAEVCGQCHVGDHHPTYTEWTQSKHAQALKDLKDNSHAEDTCLECHSADYFWDRTVTLETAQYPITCAMCHFAHGSNFAHQLRENGEEVCGLCHTTENSQPPTSPHHPQDEMLTGIAGYEWPQGGPYFNDAHTYVIDERCIKCHMYTEPYEENKPAVSGHTWQPRIEACQPCHPGAQNFNIGGAQTNITTLLTSLKGELDQQQNKSDPDYIDAKYDYDFVNGDKSKGVHNHKYAEQLLEDSIEFFTPSK